MEKTKYSIGRYSTSIVELSNSNTGARGGYRLADQFSKINSNKSAEERNRLKEEKMMLTWGEEIADEQGGYYKENYIQRMQKRRRIITELVANNFDSYSSMFITLTFDSDRVDSQIQSQKEQVEKAKSERNNLQSDLSYFVEDICDEISKHQEEYLDKERAIEALNRKHREGFFCNFKGFEMAIKRYRNIEGVDIFVEYLNIFDDLCKINGVKKVRKCCTDVNLANLADCNKLFKKFIQKMRYRYEGFKYVAVMARNHYGGQWHYHMICNIPYVSIEEFEQIWTYGGFDLQKPKETQDIYKFKNYMIKNISEQTWECLRGEKGYLASSNLKRNIIARSWATNQEEIELYEQTKKACMGVSRSFVKATDNKFNASFRYYQIKVKSTFFQPCKLAIKKSTYKFSKNNANETKKNYQLHKEFALPPNEKKIKDENTAPRINTRRGYPAIKFSIPKIHKSSHFFTKTHLSGWALLSYCGHYVPLDVACLTAL